MKLGVGLLAYRCVLTFVVLVVAGTCGAWAQDFIWARQLGGAGDDRGTGVAVDANGNVYTVGYFAGTADFDPDPNSAHTLDSAGSNDVFVSKLDSAGHYVWANRLGGTMDDKGTGVAVDANGNVYTVGYFLGMADFDPDPKSTRYLVSAGNYDVFVSKLDSEGNFVWAQRLGGTTNDHGNGVAVDTSGNVYTVGVFSGMADFDPDPTSAHNLVAAGFTGQFDVFVSKLNSAGNYVWAGRLGGTGGDLGTGVAVDTNSNVYTVGYFGGMADFNPNPDSASNLTSAGLTDVFVSKLDSEGNFVWAQRLGGTGNDQGHGVAVDANGNVYTVGLFTGTAGDSFVSKLDSAGDIVWLRQLVANSTNVCNGVAVDANGSVYTVGYFFGTADFDPDPNSAYNLVSAGGEDPFVYMLDRTGDFVWARRLGGSSNDLGTGVAVDTSGNVYTVGYFAGMADFDPEPSSAYNLTSAGVNDVFVSKLTRCLSFRLERTGPNSRLTWCGAPGASGYDVVRGSLGVLRNSPGDFSGATEDCLSNDQPGLSFILSGIPAPGNGFWFLERCDGCPGRGTYNSGAPSQVGDRDPGIAASGLDCP